MTETASDADKSAAPAETAPPLDEESAPTVEESKPRPAWWTRHYTFTGTAVGLVFLFLSLTPSLLPRGPLFQGLVS
ncbi:hypothetical protein C6A85_46370, partial [Mycobacterium sp. ITM-2017-0098]